MKRSQTSLKQSVIVEHHPRSPDASVENLRKLAGIIRLKCPAPSTRFLEEEESAPPVERAGG